MGGRSKFPSVAKNKEPTAPHGRVQISKPSSTPVPSSKYVSSRLEISAVTINMSGKSVLGVTPKYKIDLVETFLKTCPDVIFLQDSIDEDDMGTVLKNVAESKYEYYFDNDNVPAKESKETKDKSNESSEKRSRTGVAWHKDKYVGVPLDLGDERLQPHTGWLKNHDIAVVKLDSAVRHEAEDVYPSCVAVSWHGTDYEQSLRQRTADCDHLFTFLTLLRKNNRNIPIIIGGDFNLDMKSYELKKYPDFLLVPYRPVSGNLAKDLKNCFIFTYDTLQVTETSFKQHHPEIFSSPFITVKIRGKQVIRIWAIIRIQRAVRRMLTKIHERRAGIKKLKDSKKRWRRKIEGDDYVSSEEEEEEEEFPSSPHKAESPLSVSVAKISLDSAGNNHESRNTFTVEGSKSASDDFYSKPMEVPVSNYRRRHYDELKSVHDRKKEANMNSYLMRTGI